MISKLYRLLIFGLTSLASALAQVPADDGRVHFRTLGWQVAPNDLYFESKGKDIKLSVHESARSVFQLHAKTETIVFYRLIPGPEGEMVREEACTANISAAGPWPLIVFMKTKESPKRYRVIAISDDLKKFPIPSCRFINLTKFDIYATIVASLTGTPQHCLATTRCAAVAPNVRKCTVLSGLVSFENKGVTLRIKINPNRIESVVTEYDEGWDGM